MNEPNSEFRLLEKFEEYQRISFIPEKNQVGERFTPELKKSMVSDLRSLPPNSLKDSGFEDFDEKDFEILESVDRAFDCVKLMIAMLIVRVCNQNIATEEEKFPQNGTVEMQCRWIRRHFNDRLEAFRSSNRQQALLLERFAGLIVAVVRQEALLAQVSA